MSSTLPAKISTQVAAATVRIRAPRSGLGQAVMIDRGFFLTAAHCVRNVRYAALALGDHQHCTLITPEGKLTASLSAVEPIADIAVLSCPDHQDFYDEAARYDLFLEQNRGLGLMRDVPRSGEEFPIWVRTHNNGWIDGTAQYIGGASFRTKTRVEIEGGTSGGPILNQNGEVVGVVSNSSSTASAGYYSALQGLACRALPAWILNLPMYAGSAADSGGDSI